MDDSELERSCFSGRLIIGLFTFVDNPFLQGNRYEQIIIIQSGS